MQCQHKTSQCNVNTKHHNAMPTQNIAMQCQHKTSQCNVNTKHHNAMSTQNISMQCQHKTSQCHPKIYFQKKSLWLFIKSFKHHVFNAWRWLLRPKHVTCVEGSKRTFVVANGKTYVCGYVDRRLRQTDWLSFVLLAVRLIKVILRCNTERSGDAWFGVRG